MPSRTRPSEVCDIITPDTRSSKTGSSPSPRRSARFALPVSVSAPVASTSRVHAHGHVLSTPAMDRILRPPSARRPSAKAQAGSSSGAANGHYDARDGGGATPMSREKKRKSPDLPDGAAMRKRARVKVRCPAEHQPTPTPTSTRKGKGKAPSPPSISSSSSSPSPAPRSRHSHSPHTPNGSVSSSLPPPNNATTKNTTGARLTRRTARQMAMIHANKPPSTTSSLIPTPTPTPSSSSPSNPNNTANPMTLRSATPSHPPPNSRNAHVRGSSPAPGRLDEIDMGVAVGSSSQTPSSPQKSPKQPQQSLKPKLGLTTIAGQLGSPLSSPLTSPVWERAELAPWDVLGKVATLKKTEVKKEPVEVDIGTMMEGVLPSPTEEAAPPKSGLGDGEKVEGKDAGGAVDVDMPTPTPAISEEERVGTPMDEDHGGVTSTAGGSGAATAAPSSTSTTQATTPTNSTPSPATAHPRNRTCPPSPSPAPISTSTSPTSPPPSPGAGTSTSAAGAGTSPSTLIPTGRTSPSPSISAPARSLSPDDFAPSPFAPPAFPVPEELSPLAPSSAPISTPGTGAASGAMGSGAGLVGPGQAAPFAPAHDSTPVLDPLGFTGPGPGPLLVDTMLAHGIAPGPPVSPDWPLPHAPFALPSLSLPSGSGSVSSAAGPSTALYGSSGAQQGYGLFAASAYASGSSSASHFSPGLHFPTSQQQQAPPPTPAERHSRAVEWSALLERRRLAGERALADEREAEERRRAGERWVGEWGVPVGRGVRVERSKAPAVGSGAEGSGQGGAEAQGPEDVEMPMSVPPQGEVDYVPEDAYAEEDYSRMRRRSPLCIVSSAPRSEDTPPSPLVLSPDTSLSTPEVQQQEQTQHLAPEDAPVPQNVNGNGNGPRTDLVYEVQPQLRKQDDDLGPDPATRMNTAWGPWKIACRTRVWDVRQRYTPSLIRSLVAQEADDYFSSHGLPHPDSLLFMDEEYYDWELEESASEGEGDGSGDGSGSGEDESFEVDPAQQQQSFVLEPSHLSPTSPRSPSSPRDSGANSENEDADADADGEAGMEMDLAANGMGGVLSSFYIAPQQQAHFPPQMQMPMHLPPLPLPPPPLASVRVPVLRHFFTDIPITPAGGEGAVRGRGTPIDYARKAAWGGGKVGGDAGEIGEGEVGADLGRGTLERRQPHPRPRPHPMYLAMARAAEAERAQYGGGEGGPVEGVADQDLPPMPRLREPGEPPMLPMRGLKDLVRSMRGPGGEEEEGTPEERLERERREMSEAFEPDEAVWQEFLKSVGVESTTVAATGEDGRDAMDVDAGQQNSIDADADADSDPDYDIEESGGAGGTSGGVALGLPPASISSTPGSSSGSMLSGGVGMGVEMSIGMFGMAMGAMGMGGWFTGPPSPPVPVAVGDGGGERERESSLSFALGV